MGVAVGRGVNIGVLVAFGVAVAEIVTRGVGEGAASKAWSVSPPLKSNPIATNAAKPLREPFLLFRRLVITSPSFV